MKSLTLDQETSKPLEKVEPLCPVFGICGGCCYQDISYADELCIKEKKLRDLFAKSFNLPGDVFQPLVPSPAPYYYRNRLDLSLCRSRGDIIIGFQVASSKRLIPVDPCRIVRVIFSMLAFS